MNRIFRFLVYRTSIATKIFAFTCAMLIAWGTLFYFGAYRKTLNLVQLYVEDSMARSLETVYREQNATLDEMDKASNLLFTNKVFQRLLISGLASNTYIEQFEIYQEIKEVLNSFANNFPDLEMRFYLEKPTLYTAEERSLFIDKDALSQEWYQKALDADGAIIWSTNFDRWTSSYQRIPAVAQIRVIKDTDMTGERIGVMSISLAKNNIKNVLEKAIFADSVVCFMTDGNMNIIESTDNADDYANALNSEIEKRGNRIDDTLTRIRMKDNIMMFYKINPRNGWTTALVIPYNRVTEEVKQMLVNALILFFISFLVISLVSFIYSRSVVNRISKISVLIDQLENQNFASDLPILYHDELSVVEKRINRLIIRIHDLLSEVKETERGKRHAELLALQSQINPHFLYNTLDSINWMAVHANQMEIAQAVTILGRFLRIGLSGNQNMISLSDEIEHVRCYLQIQQIRFKGQINAVFTFDPSILAYEIPKIILQPFVENAVLHGFMDAGRETGTIKIEGQLIDGVLQIQIMDDGVGFNQFEEKEKTTFEQNKNKRSYGIANVRERMNLIYGSDARISVVSEVGIGTTVNICWPARLARNVQKADRNH